MAVNVSGGSAIVGLGITDMTRYYTKPGALLAAEAIKLAMDDAGLKKDDIDGLLTNAGISDPIGLGFQVTMGMRNLPSPTT